MTRLDRYLHLFDYHLPDEHIAQQPASPRDSSKLLVLNRNTGNIKHHIFADLVDIFNPNDVLVLNQTKVFPARIKGKKSTGGKTELVLHRQVDINTWEAVGFGTLKAGNILNFAKFITAEVISKDNKSGLVTVKFNVTNHELLNSLNQIGLTPLPPYINQNKNTKQTSHQYQTTYAKNIGSSAAPTAGLHFTNSLLKKLRRKGVGIEYLTLHVGPGTFMPIRSKNLNENKLHREFFHIDTNAAKRLTQAKKDGKRIISVGTTTTRALESAYQSKRLISGKQSTQLFIKPPHKFNFIDSLITNFHLPQSSLLMLVSAFVSYPNTDQKFTTFKDSTVGNAYQQAIQNNYRFYSFGDATMIL